MSRVALVTGANRGIGLETARQLAGRGFTVLLGSRDLGRGREAARSLSGDGAVVVPVQLDVTDCRSVRAARDAIERDHRVLDLLVNNAGAFTGATATTTSASDMRLQFEVNVFGVVTMIRAMLPLIARSSSGRIVNVSSTTASLGLTAGGVDLPGDADVRLAYASSKAALNMLTIQYGRAFARDESLRGIKINSATPGYTATDMNARRGTRRVDEGARIIVELATLPDDGPSGGFYDDDGPVEW
jgi:NAD(P)-dependent dehydrogenase (short-subunit alcohol dehydrogenase family)